MRARILRMGTLALLFGAILLGCTSISTRTLEKGAVTMTEAQFAAQVERVFRYHNRVMDDLIRHTIDLSEQYDDSGPLREAEATMARVCEPLNEVVAAESVSQDAGFRTKSRLPEAVPDCEAATRDLEVLLWETFKKKSNSMDLIAR